MEAATPAVLAVKFSTSLNQTLTSLQARWSSYLGWTLNTFVADEQARETIRVIADRRPFRLAVYRSGAAFGYSLYNDHGELLIKLIGDSISHPDDTPSARQAIPEHLLYQVLWEISLLTNEIADWRCTEGKSDGAKQTFRVCAPWGGEADVVLAQSGACERVVIHSANSATYRPVKISRLTRRHKIYCSWVRNDDTPIDLTWVRPGCIVYKGE